MKENHIFYLKIAGVLIFLAISIGVEQAYRQPLFDKTLEWTENWQKSNPGAQGFFKFISELGTGPVLIPLLVIVFLWFPINKSFTFLNVLIYGYYLDNVMKLMYGNPRPFWVKPSLFISCNGGYGNPSGHSFSSISCYLAFWHIITDFDWFKKSLKGKLIRFSLLIFFVVMPILIMMSRVYLGAHSVNQVLYGGILGFVLYYVLFYVVEWPFMEDEKFWSIFREKKNIIINSIIFACLLIIGFLCWALIDNNSEFYKDIIDSLCPDQNDYREFNQNGLFGSLSVFGVIGGYYALVFLIHLIDKNYTGKTKEVNFWYKGNFKSQLLKVLISAGFGLPIILTFIVSGKASLPVIFTFKVSLPYLLAIFGMFGPAIYFTCKLGFANPDLYLTPNVNANSEMESNKLKISSINNNLNENSDSENKYKLESNKIDVALHVEKIGE